MYTLRNKFYIFTVMFCVLATAEAAPITTHTESLGGFTNTTIASGDITSNKRFNINIGRYWLVNIAIVETDANDDDLVITGNAQHIKAPHEEPIGPGFNFYYDLNIDSLPNIGGTTTTYTADKFFAFKEHSIDENFHQDSFTASLEYQVADRNFSTDDDITFYKLIVNGIHTTEPDDPIFPTTTTTKVPVPSTMLLIAMGLVLLIINRKKLRIL